MKRSAGSLSTTNKGDLLVFILVLSVVTVASVLATTWQSGSAETARALAERARNAAGEQLAQARSEEEAVQRSVNDQGGQLGQERTAREAAEAAVRETREQLIQERTARKAAERALKDLRGGHRGPNDLGHLFDLGQLFFFGPRFFDH